MVCKYEYPNRKEPEQFPAEEKNLAMQIIHVNKKEHSYIHYAHVKSTLD